MVGRGSQSGSIRCVPQAALVADAAPLALSLRVEFQTASGSRVSDGVWLGKAGGLHVFVMGRSRLIRRVPRGLTRRVPHFLFRHSLHL